MTNFHIGTNIGTVGNHIDGVRQTVYASDSRSRRTSAPEVAPATAAGSPAPPLRIVLAMSGAAPATGIDGSLEWYDTAEELQAILAEVERGPGRDRVDVRTFPAITAAGLQKAVNLRPHVLHLSAVPLADGVVLDPQGHSPASSGEVMAWHRFEEILGHTDSPPRLVVLNSCWSETVARRLLAYVDVVVGLPYAQGAATPFAASFYGALLRGQPVRAALDQADNALVSKDLPTIHPDCAARHHLDLTATRLVEP